MDRKTSISNVLGIKMTIPALRLEKKFVTKIACHHYKTDAIICEPGILILAKEVHQVWRCRNLTNNKPETLGYYNIETGRFLEATNKRHSFVVFGCLTSQIGIAKVWYAADNDVLCYALD